jgi:hypothetical protein
VGYNRSNAFFTRTPIEAISRGVGARDRSQSRIAKIALWQQSPEWAVRTSEIEILSSILAFTMVTTLPIISTSDTLLSELKPIRYWQPNARCDSKTRSGKGE